MLRCAVTYKETLDRLNGPESAVIMSAGHNDEERLARWHLGKEEQDRLIERFKDRNDPLAVLIVCDMLLTGFDVPVEQVMYLDAPLKEHTLLQAIARVNRPHGDEKTYGLVVDYWGVSADLQDALAVFSTTDVQGALTPNADELPRLQSRHAAAMRFFQTVADTSDLDACVRVLEPNDVRTAFDLAFRRFSQSMDMLLPDQRALAYHADLRWLGKIRGTARARYRDDRLDLSGCGEKVRKLIADAVVADGIQILVKEVQLFSPEFEEKVAALATDDAKASEMEHAIRHEINVRVEENPVFYQSLRERLEAIIAERRQERMDAAEQLSLLSSLRDDLKAEQTRAQDIGLDARGFAIYGLLERQRPGKTKEKTATYDVGQPRLGVAHRRGGHPVHGPGRLAAEGRPAAADAQPDQAAAPRRWHRRRYGGVPRRRHRGPRQGAQRPMTATETSAITWGETQVAYTIRRSARRKKTVAVTVDPTGGVLLVAPEHFATSRLDAVVRRKAAWIVQRLRRVQSHDPPLSPREFVSGESVLYLGRHYRLKVHPNESGDAKLRGGWLYVPAPAGALQTAHVRAALVSWLRRHAAQRLPERVEAWRSKAGVAMPPVIIADQQKRWGSCDRTGTIRLNWAHHPGPDALGRLCRRPRARTSAASWSRTRLLAGRRPRDAGLRTPPGRFTATWRGVGVVARPLTPARGLGARRSESGPSWALWAACERPGGGRGYAAVMRATLPLWWWRRERSPAARGVSSRR